MLTPGAATKPLADTITMVDMGMAEYAGLEDINVEITGYSCGTDGIAVENAWDSIMQHSWEE